MKKFKKVIALMLMMIMVLSLAACGDKSASDTSDGGKNDTSNDNATSDEDKTEGELTGDYGGLQPLPDADDPITFKVFIRDPGMAPSKDNPIIKRIEELTGVTMEYEFLVGDLAQKVGVMIAGEDYPDAIFAESAKFIDAGAYIPLEDYLPDYPNLYNHYNPHKDKVTAEDGHQYILELYGIYENPAPIFTNGGSGFYIQKAVLEEAGYPIPKTTDEYFDIIEAYKDKHPEINGVPTIGFEVLTDGWRDFCLRNPAMHLLGSGNEGNVVVDQTTYEASMYQNTETAKNYYKKLNEEYKKGVIQGETLVQNYDQYISRISTGAVLGFFDQSWNFGNAENVLKSDGQYERTYVSVPIANEGVQDSYLDSQSSNITGLNGIGITTKCKDPERLLRYYDYLLQPEVQDLLQWGVEGENYVINENGEKVLTEEGRAISQDETRRRDESGYIIANYSPKMQGLYDDGTAANPDASTAEYFAGLSDYDKEFLAAYDIDYPTQLLSEPADRPAYYPVWGMTIEDGSPAKVAENKLVDVCRKYYPQLILAEDDAEFDSIWNAFLAEFEDSGYDVYLKEVQRQIDAVMK